VNPVLYAYSSSSFVVAVRRLLRLPQQQHHTSSSYVGPGHAAARTFSANA